MWNRHYNWDKDNLLKYLLYLEISFQLSIAYCYGLQWELNLSYSNKNTALIAAINSRVLWAASGYLTFAICLKRRSQWVIKQISKNENITFVKRTNHSCQTPHLVLFFKTFLWVRQSKSFWIILTHLFMKWIRFTTRIFWKCYCRRTKK